MGKAAEFRAEVAFVDTRIEGYETIVAGVAPDAEVVLIDGAHDGLAQIAAALGGRSDIAAVHIFSHGESGSLQVGATHLSLGNMGDYANDLAVVRSAMTPGGDLMLYGCDVAAGDAGQAFIDALASATGADVAASTDLTGSVLQHGDWVLEAQTGRIETAVALTTAGQQAFSGTLSIGSENFDSLGLLTDTSTEFIAGNWKFTSSSPVDVAVANSDEFATYLNLDGGAGDRAVLLNYSGAFGVSGYTMGSADGSNFSLTSFLIGQALIAGTPSANVTITAYSDGEQVGDSETVDLSASGTHGGISYTVAQDDDDGRAGSLSFNSAYADIDEIRFSFDGDATLTIDDIVAAPAVVDTTAPVFSSAEVDGDTLVMSYADANALDAAHAPGAGAFAVMAGGDSVAVDAVTVDAIARTVTLTLHSAVAPDEGVTVAYTDPTGGNDVNAIQDAAGNDAASLAATGVTNNTVDLTPPSVSGDIAVPTNGSYHAGQTLTFTVTFDEDITVAGTDSTLGLTVGSTGRDAAYDSKTANSITYAYTVQAGDIDVNGVTVLGIQLGTTTVRDAAGNDADLTLTGHVPPTAGILVDTAAPEVASVDVPTDATYAAGQDLDFTVTFNENVSVTGTDSTLGLTIGETSRSAAFLSSSGDTVTYRYTVQAGETDADGIDVGSLTLGGDTIRDAAGNDATLTLNSVGPTSGVLVDADVPGVAGDIAVPAADTYVAGETLSFTVTFSENVMVTGTDSTLGLTIGGTSRTAAYDSKTANSITYSYTVQAGDTDGDGIAVGGITLGTSTIQDATGNDASLALSGHVPATTGVLVDTTAPSFASATVNGAALVMTYADAGLLDAAHAPTAGAFTVLAGGSPVSVTGVAVNGAAHTVTLTLASPVAAGAAVTVAYGDPTGGNDANAIQDAGGNDAASLSATSVTNNTSPPTPPQTDPPPPPSTETVDGVPVETVTGTASDGTPTQTLTIPVVLPTRTDQVGGNQVADIPLVKDASGASLLALQAPAGYGLTASGSAQPKPAGNALDDLIREIKAHTASGSQDQSQLTGAGADFLNDLDTSTPMLVQTIVTTASPGVGSQPLTISGQPEADGQPQTALIIDLRDTPGIHIELQNVEFAAVVGPATITGGAGSQHVWGDVADQNILLGADDDVLNGGGGDDTVGSATGHDQVHGDDGDDVVFGGEDSDLVHGNAGNDTVRGDAGDDQVYGGKGEDQVFGGDANDLMFGDLGQDFLQGNAGRDTLDGGEGADVLHGGQDADVLFGGADADLALGDNGDDILQGNLGDDTLQGGVGNDLLHGGQDDDVLVGGEGRDTLSGDLGDDVLTGGSGADVFIAYAGSGVDRVLDFNFAEGDRVNLLAGTTYSAAQVGADTVITMTGGGQMTLAHVQLSSLSDGWITVG